MNDQPKKTDNLTKIRAFLKGGARITSILILNRVGTTEVRHYLSILRKEGLVVHDRWIEQNGKRFKEWYLEFK